MNQPQPKPFCISKQAVLEAWERVKANKGAAGIDEESIRDFERKLKANLYRVWNRMSSGSYLPPAVRTVAIPKPGGGERKLGIPTVADRVAQMVVKRQLEPKLEPLFHVDSYGYRPFKSAQEAVGRARQRCWRYDWVLDLDIKGFLDPCSYYTLAAEGWSKSCGWLSNTRMRKPFCLPRLTWTTESSPRFTRCMIVCRDTPRMRMACGIAT
jgi:retron-type reverse transcriptase